MTSSAIRTFGCAASARPSSSFRNSTCVSTLGLRLGFVGKSDLSEDGPRRIVDRARRRMTDGKPQRHFDIFLHAHASERPRNLISAGQPVLRPDPGRRCGNVVAVEGYRSAHWA